MAPRPDVSAERKQQIYQAALACFGRHGYHQTTMDDIVAESGLSKGALYWYFGSKKELFLSLFSELMTQFGEGWKSLVSDEMASATAKLHASMELFRTALAEMVPFFGVIVEAWALTRHDQDVESLMAQFYAPFVEIMDHIIEQGVASGEFSAVSARATSLVVMTLFDGITLAMATGLWQYDWDEIVNAAEDLVLTGLGVTAGDARQ